MAWRRQRRSDSVDRDNDAESRRESRADAGSEVSLRRLASEQDVGIGAPTSEHRGGRGRGDRGRGKGKGEGSWNADSYGKSAGGKGKGKGGKGGKGKGKGKGGKGKGSGKGWKRWREEQEEEEEWLNRNRSAVWSSIRHSDCVVLVRRAVSFCLFERIVCASCVCVCAPVSV